MIYPPPAGGGGGRGQKTTPTTPATPPPPPTPASTWQFTEGIAFTFPQNVTIPAGGFALVVPIDPATFRGKYNIPASVQIFGPYNGALNNGGESVKLSRPGTPGSGITPYITVDHVNYDNDVPWPLPPDGTGPSLARTTASAYANDPINWQSGPVG